MLQQFALPFEVKQPLVVAYGMGVDSTACLVEFARLQIRPDLIMFANVGGAHWDHLGVEKQETYNYLQVINAFLTREGFPQVVPVRYIPKNFKNWPPYYTLEENCLTNATLPSKVFGKGSCSEKWKAQPQHKYLKSWRPALEAWSVGLKVKKVIGYDCSPADVKRYCNAENPKDAHLYEFWYPLRDWGWKREDCQAAIAKAGLPVPPKSSCFFCPGMKPWEVRELPEDKLKRIVLMEARAKPRLRNVDGIWRKAIKGFRGATPRPGSMTEFIRKEGLLPADEVDRIIAEAPTEIVRYQESFHKGLEVNAFGVFVDKLLNPAARAA
jgi:hypothetical protein